MSSSKHELYLKNNFSLARSLIIKSTMTAEAINNELSLNGHTISDDPSQWKYYLNLSGTLHESDEVMTIVSIDTLEPIEVNIENLDSHRATAVALRTGGDIYVELVNKYPRQQILINGMLNPIDSSTAISAADHTILGYDETLVESNETNLLSELQKWIRGFTNNWYTYDYTITDDLYPTAYLAVLYSHITNAILKIRLDNCKTYRAHSFHISSYLAGYYRVDEFIDALTLKQQLFLYRNIDYIAQTAHTKETFEVLVDNLLTDRGIPLYGYYLSHNPSNLLEDGVPKIEMRRDSINYGELVSSGDDEREVKDILLDGMPTGIDNYVMLDSDVDRITKMAVNAPADSYITKVLESDIRDFGDIQGVSLARLYINRWLALASNTKTADNASLINQDQYRTQLSIVNPVTKSNIRLDVRTSWTLLLWLIAKSDGIDLVNIPSVTVKAALKEPLPSLAYLRKFIHGTFHTDNTINNLTNFPSSGVIVSSIEFKQYVDDLYKALNNSCEFVRRQENSEVRMRLTLLMDSLFEPKEYKFHEGTYVDWFGDMAIDLSDLTEFDASTMASSIINKFTGSDGVESLSTYRIQTMLIDLVRRLSHHDLQYLSTLTDGSIQYAKTEPILVESVNATGSSEPTMDDHIADPMDVNGAAYAKRDVDENQMTYEHDVSSSSEVKLDDFVVATKSSIASVQITIPLTVITTGVINTPNDPEQ